MSFAQLTQVDLDSMDFSLPEVESGLPGIPAETFNFYLGAPTFGHKDWYGSLYPKKTKASDHIHEYVKHFNFIELNSTFFKSASAQQVLDWVKAVEHSPDFKFCPRFPQQIGLVKRLKNASEPTKQFIEVCGLFGSHLGPTFLELSKSFGGGNFKTLEDYLSSLPPDFVAHVELHHKDWLIDNNFKAIIDLFRRLGIGTVYNDRNDRRDLLRMPLTTKTAFIRFYGNKNHRSDKQRLLSWRERILQWKREGLEAAYLTLNEPFENHFADLVGNAKEIFKDLIKAEVKAI